MTDAQVLSKMEAIKKLDLEMSVVDQQIERVLELMEKPGMLTHITIQGYEFNVPFGSNDHFLLLLGSMHKQFVAQREELVRKAEVIIKEN